MTEISLTVWGPVIGWGMMALIWLGALPQDTRGKTWHRVLALLPLPLLALAALASPAIAEPLRLWSLGGVAVGAVLIAAWLAGTLRKNHGLMDVFYPLAPLAAATTILAASGGPATPQAWLFIALLTVWTLRLAVQTWGQNHADEREPYASWRRRFGLRWTWFSLFQVHAIQGVSIWIWIAPFAFIAASAVSWPAAIAGALVWFAGFGLQTVADNQLTRFRADPANRGRLLDTGAWALVRHPNYLGEVVMWWGWFVMALGHPWGWLTLPAPLCATWFMGWASAAPFKERHMARTRPEAWAAYSARTPRFFPLPRPRSETAR